MNKLLLLIFLMIVQSSFGQIAKTNDSVRSSDIETGQTVAKDTTFTDELAVEEDSSLKILGQKEVGLGIFTLVVLLLILLLSVWLIRKSNMSEDSSVKLILSVVVIISTLFLVVAGYDDKTIAPAFGLFGTVIGYIFGKSNSKRSKNE